MHIISFDVPYPADYGGAIDIFYKIKNLASLGCEIYLHCYLYGREEATELNKYCKEVWYYKRQTGIAGISLRLPYIVASRQDKTLLQRLQQIDAPILFEGVHSTYFLAHPSLKARYKAIRVHNVEHDYYSQLSKKNNSLFTKLFFIREAFLLKKYEHQLTQAQAFVAISLKDGEYFKKIYPNAIHSYIPAFHPYHKISILHGLGNYCLYHGNLSHPENSEAAMYLINEIIPHIHIPVFIAGKNPANDLIELCSKTINCTLVQNPLAEQMEQLIQNAQVHILPTFQQSGMKLKLLSALFAGRYVVANLAMLYGTELKNVCEIANDTPEFISKINQLIYQPFTEKDIKKREGQMKFFFNEENAALLKELFFK